jgi:hypothetical protein
MESIYSAIQSSIDDSLVRKWTLDLQKFNVELRRESSLEKNQAKPATYRPKNNRQLIYCIFIFYGRSFGQFGVQT